MKSMHGRAEAGPGVRARCLSSDLEKAVDRVLLLERQYAIAVRRMVARGGAPRASLAGVDDAREYASRLLVAWSHNPLLEQHAVVAQDALADLMEKTLATTRKDE
jgi:hypothetical protein